MLSSTVIQNFKKIENRTILSYVWNFVFAGIKIFLAIYSQSMLLFIYSFYNIGIAFAKRTTLKRSPNYSRIGTIVALTSLVYLIYSVYIWFHGSNSEYDMNTAIGIATFTFTEIVLVVIGIRRARKNHQTRDEVIEYINLATASISLSLTQTALLSFKNEGDMSKFYALGDAFFGFIALLIGVYMIFHFRKSKAKLKSIF